VPLAALLVGSAAAGTAHAADPVPLIPGQPQIASMQAGERLAYELAVADSGPLLVIVDQNGLDIRVTITAADGDPRVFNSSLERDDRETVLLETAPQGTIRIELDTAEYTRATATPSIEVRRADSMAAPELDALRLMTLGAAANATRGPDNRQASLDAYSGAVERWREAGDTREQARAMFGAAQIAYAHMLDWEGSARLASTAAEFYERAGETGLAANARHLQAAALIEQANELDGDDQAAGVEADDLFAEALALFEQSRSTQAGLGRLYDAARTVNNVGLTHYYRGDWDAARVEFRKAAVQFREIGELSGELMPLSNLAVIDWEEGELTAAKDTLERILVILPPGKYRSYRAATLDNLAGVNLAMGRLTAALQGFSDALAFHESLGSTKGQGRSLAGIGTTYYGFGERELAREYLERALVVRREAGDGRGQAAVLRYLGNLYRLDGEFDRALSAHEQARALAASPADRAKAGLLIGEDLNAAGRHGEAIPVLEDARATAATAGARVLEADLRLALAAALTGAGDGEPARAQIMAAREVYESVGLEAGQARALYLQAVAEREAGRLEDAARHGAEAVEQIERLRSRIVDPELRAFYLGSRRDYYDLQVDVLMGLARETGQREHLSGALEVAERGRARALVDLLHEAAVDVPIDGDPELLARQRALYDRLSELRFQRARVADQPEEAERLGTILAELSATENALNVLDLDLRRRAPRHAGLTRPRILSAAGMQALLDDDTVLLQYALAEPRSYLWIVTPDHVEAVELTGRSTIEAQARRAYQRLSVLDATGGPSRPDELARLSALVLAPAADRLAARRRVVVVADGALQYIPFSVLEATDASGRRARLIDRYEVLSAPSMSAVAANRRSRGAGDPPGKTIAIIADPVFGPDDPRAADLVATAARPSASAGLPARQDLSRLPYSGREASEIAGLVPAPQRWLASGFAANREAVLSAPLGDYRLLHFATHGLLDARYPALSALSLSRLDDQGRSIDGDLRLHDIYNLRLRADVVVLSACDTALGREVRGEGLIGLSQGFMYAGAQSVVASLWRVPDRTTAELMKRFYSAMLEDGRPPGEALALAQRAIADEPLWRDPFFWGAFVIQGGEIGAALLAEPRAAALSR
jgi:CHAT domain-containing protein